MKFRQPYAAAGQVPHRNVGSPIDIVSLIYMLDEILLSASIIIKTENTS